MIIAILIVVLMALTAPMLLPLTLLVALMLAMCVASEIDAQSLHDAHERLMHPGYEIRNAECRDTVPWVAVDGYFETKKQMEAAIPLGRTCFRDKISLVEGSKAIDACKAI